MRILAALLLLPLTLPSVSTANQSSVVFVAKWGPPQIAGPWDVAPAPDGTVLVSDQGAIKRFAPDGTLLEQWLLPPVGINPNGLASLIAVDDQGFLYAPAGFGYVQKLTLSGSLIAQWRTVQTTPGVSPQAYGVAVGSDGNIFLSDSRNRNIQKFTPTGEFLSRWFTANDGQLLAVTGIAADRAGRVFALNQYGGTFRVDVFDLDGNSLFHFGSNGTGNGQFQGLTDIAIDASGHVFISDEFLRRVQEFGPDGSLIAVLDPDGVKGTEFQGQIGVGADAQGNVFVADGHAPAVQKFSPVATPAIPVSWGRLKATYHGP